MVEVAFRETGVVGFAVDGADATVCAFVVWVGAVDEDPKENGEAADPAGAGAGAVNEKGAAAGAAAPLLPSTAVLFAPSVFASGAGLLLGAVNVNPPAAAGVGVLAAVSSLFAS